MNILELGHAVLYVTNLEKSASFYHDVLGFPEIGRSIGMVAFSSGRTHHELLISLHNKYTLGKLLKENLK